MSRITIDYTPAVQQSAGIGRLTREVTRALLALPAPHAYTLLCMGRAAPPPLLLLTMRFVSTQLSDRWLHRIWFRARLPLPVEVLAGPADLYHATDFLLPPMFTRRTVLTVHDLTFERDPGSAAPTLLRFLQRVVPASARRASHIVADSHATARDLAELYGIDPQRVTVIHSGVDARFRPYADAAEAAAESAALRAKYDLGTAPFVLTVGTLQRRKNHLGLVRAFARLASHNSNEKLNLVISGGKGWLYDEVLAEVRALGLADRVRFTGFAAEEDLPALYRAAAVFAFPSFYEGFGLPLLEAMASGVPVVSSNASSLPEVVGDAALTFDPRDDAALAAALLRTLDDAAWRTAAIERGLARARAFTWERAARQLVAVYESVLQSPPISRSRLHDVA
ncbi:MAG: glycosyltransferase family 1 protein [Chloroflexi bacterium]|nr:glycosyltransferase family 1 protein [Chloroflexota bacterium]